ncbi:hypothetical protein [Streptomyces sp. NPDC086777]|uniref:hypothetical protein n=1 Tax=Streptomyces sp. NPDC086777 TaxID=3154866 RepID=UPI00344FF8E5
MSVKACSGVKRKAALGVTALTAVAASAVPAPAAAASDGDHWGVITRNTIGSPVAELRTGPF